LNATKKKAAAGVHDWPGPEGQSATAGEASCRAGAVAIDAPAKKEATAGVKYEPGPEEHSATASQAGRRSAAATVGATKKDAAAGV
jgi:hypothetical protein